ncbi:MAG: phage head closure protein [Anaerolineaceae bacterium]|nr:phage head closure protein [Anaerolineaceae bacterium]
MINAGKYNKRIEIYGITYQTDADGFQTAVETLVLTTYASVKTTRGITLIRNNTDFEQATTNFTIRYPVTQLNRDMKVHFNGKVYSIEYMNNVDENNVELELQCKEVTH